MLLRLRVVRAPPRSIRRDIVTTQCRGYVMRGAVRFARRGMRPRELKHLMLFVDYKPLMHCLREVYAGLICGFVRHTGIAKGGECCIVVGCVNFARGEVEIMGEVEVILVREGSLISEWWRLVVGKAHLCVVWDRPCCLYCRPPLHMRVVGDASGARGARREEGGDEGMLLREIRARGREGRLMSL